MNTKKQKLMTEQQFTAKFKKAGFELYKTADLKPKLEKSEKWDRLEGAVSEFYNDEVGEYSEENPKRKGDLCDIGEVAARAFGWL